MSITTEDTRETLEETEGQIDAEKLFAEDFARLTNREAPKQEEEETLEEKEEATPEASPEPEQQPQAASEPTNEWFDSLPDVAKQHVQELMNERSAIENNYKALHNRLAPTQRQLAEAQRRLKELTPQTQPAQGDASKETQKAKEEQAEKDELWEKIRDSDPTLTEAIEKQLAKERAAWQREMEERLRPINQRTYDDDIQREVEYLLHLVPNAVDVMSSPVFQDWLGNQAESVQAMYSSPRHQDALAMLRLFDSDVARYEASLAAQQPAQPAAQPAAPDPAAKQVAQRREEKLRSPLPQTAKQIAAAGSVREEDAEGLFNKIFDQQYKQASTPFLRR